MWKTYLPLSALLVLKDPFDPIFILYINILYIAFNFFGRGILRGVDVYCPDVPDFRKLHTLYNLSPCSII